MVCWGRGANVRERQERERHYLGHQQIEREGKVNTSGTTYPLPDWVSSWARHFFARAIDEADKACMSCLPLDSVTPHPSSFAQQLMGHGLGERWLRPVLIQPMQHVVEDPTQVPGALAVGRDLPQCCFQTSRVRQAVQHRNECFHPRVTYRALWRGVIEMALWLVDAE